MKKKIVSLSLATVMAMSSAMVAIAADPTAATQAANDATISSTTDGGVYGASAEITGSTAVPTIKVTVPTVGDIAVNPYQMSYTLGSLGAATDEVFSPEYTIKNESNVPISVGVTVTGKPEGEAVFATTPVADATVKTKSVFAYIEFSSDGSYADAYNSKATNQVVLGTKAVTKNNVVTLERGDGGSATTAKYKFMGSAASAPTKAWANTDKIGATVAFTFTPILPTT